MGRSIKNCYSHGLQIGFERFSIFLSTGVTFWAQIALGSIVGSEPCGASFGESETNSMTVAEGSSIRRSFKRPLSFPTSTGIMRR
jgi:hypothetical protein